MDRLTQLQDTLDDLMTQMYATLKYIQEKHPYGDFPGQPSQAPLAAHPTGVPSSDQVNGDGQGASSPVKTNGNVETKQAKADKERDAEDKKDTTAQHIPDLPDVFQSTMRELARGLVLQEQKAEILINSLPGLGNSEEDQMARMRELEVELRQVEAERARAEEERERMVDVLGEVLVGAQRAR